MEKKIIGYQIVDTDSGADIPEVFFSFVVMSETFCKKWLADNNLFGEWKMVPVYDGDIEEPTFFDGLFTIFKK